MISTASKWVAAGSLLAVMAAAQSAPMYLNQSFEMFLPTGWAIVNNSTGPANATTTSWFAGDSNVFTAQSGSVSSYAAANYLAAPDNGSPNSISDWLFTPLLTFTTGMPVTFYTRSAGVPLGDSLEVRYSTAGSSTNVGTTTTSVGDFTNVLTLVPVATYPTQWTQYTANITGPVGDGRVAFRYVVADNSTGGNYIGVDTVVVGTAPAAIPEPATPAVMALGFAALALVLNRHTRRKGVSKQA